MPFAQVWTHFLFFHIFIIEILLNSAKWTHWQLNGFFLLNPIFAIFLNFQQERPLQNAHLSSENCEINSIKSDLSRASQGHQEFPPNSNNFFSFNFSSFSLKKWFNNQQLPHHNSKQFQTKSAHPYLSRSFCRYKEQGMKHVICEISVWQTKQNKPPCFIDRYLYQIHA